MIPHIFGAIFTTPPGLTQPRTFGTFASDNRGNELLRC